MAKILNSMNFDSKDEKSSTPSIKMVDIADGTTIVIITKTKKK